MSKDRQRALRFAELVTIGLVMMWGINTPIMKIGMTNISPIQFNAMRLLLAAVISVLIMFALKRYRPMAPGDLKKMILLGLVGFGFSQITLVVGMPATTAGNASLVFATLPVCVAIINRIQKIETLSRRVTAGILLSFAGILIIVIGAGKEISLTGPHIIGALVLLSGQFCYSFYTVSINKLIGDYSIYQLIAYIMVINAALFGVLAAADAMHNGLGELTWTVLFCVTFSGVFALSAGNAVWVWAVGELGTTRASVYHNLSPLFAISFAWVAIGEAFGLIQSVGAAVIFLGLYLSRR
jgi:drug/metabolite transporter (DMT)-like permease